MANNYKGTQRKFGNKESVSKQAQKQKRFHEYYCSGRHNGREDWVIILIGKRKGGKSCIYRAGFIN